MKIIEQSHEIISLPDNLLQIIETAGRTCYKSEEKTGCTIYNEQCPHKPAEWEEPCIETWCEHHSSQNFIKMLLDRGHHAMIEFGDITVRFITNRGVTHELVRHRLCSFAQESTRYVRYDGKKFQENHKLNGCVQWSRLKADITIYWLKIGGPNRPEKFCLTPSRLRS